MTEAAVKLFVPELTLDKALQTFHILAIGN